MPKKMTHTEFVDRVSKERNEEFIVLGTYINFRTKVLVSHKVCGVEYETLPSTLLHYRKQCRKCFLEESGRKRSLGKEVFASRVKSIYGESYEILGDYVNTETKTLVRHSCGYEWEVYPNNFLRGHGCAKCAGNKKKTQFEFIKEVFDLTGDEYSVLGSFKNVEEKILMRHELCGHEWTVRPSHFTKNNRRCPNCVESSGEKSVEEALNKFYCNYVKEYSFPNCRDKRELRFDFAITDGLSIVMLIEYDGIQHFKVTGGWGTEEQLKVTKKRDAIKNNYCVKNGIPLVRIPYWEKENIEAILKEKLLPKLNKQCSFIEQLSIL